MATKLTLDKAGRVVVDEIGIGAGIASRIKQLLAETMLDNRMLREVSKKKW